MSTGPTSGEIPQRPNAMNERHEPLARTTQYFPKNREIIAKHDTQETGKLCDETITDTDKCK